MEKGTGLKRKTATATHWACAAASVMATGRTLILLMTSTENYKYVSTQIVETHLLRATCILIINTLISGIFPIDVYIALLHKYVSHKFINSTMY